VRVQPARARQLARICLAHTGAALLQDVYRMLIAGLRRLADPQDAAAFSRAASLLSTLVKVRI